MIVSLVKLRASTRLCGLSLMSIFFTLGLLCALSISLNAQSDDLENTVTHHYADNDGVKIHYVTKGEGPLILFVHGFPDFWYTWRDQMEAFSTDYKVAAVDLRGYNLSDSPKGVAQYTMNTLVQDLIAVIKDTGAASVHLVAHDWGAGISWQLAAKHPDLIDKLVILSIAHPKAGDKSVPIAIDQKEPSYADYFVSDDFANQLTENWFSGWVKQSAKERYKQAFRNSDKEAMINYYKANFPTLENLKKPEFSDRHAGLPNIKMPVLIVHGAKDVYALIQAHNNTWDYVDNELTIEVLPNSGHFIQQDESEKLTEMIRYFLSKN